MKDDDPRAYKKAPGDSAKTKPSQYTTRYKQMYGEDIDKEFETFLEQSSALDRLKKFDKSREAAGKKPIFTPSKPTSFVRMKKAGQMTIMNVPSDEVGKYKAKGYYTIESIDEEFENFLEYTVTPSSHLAPTSAPRDIIPSVFASDDEDPSDRASRKSKVDILLRLGLVPKDEIQKYRRALRNRDSALKNLLDKLLDFSTSDSAVYQKLRRSVTQEDAALMKKHDNERERLKLRQARERGAAKVRAIRRDNLKDEVELDEKALKGLQNKAEKSGIPYGILKQVYNRGMAAWKTGHRPGASQQQWAYARVNSFITGGN
jgi:hypothetical protein